MAKDLLVGSTGFVGGNLAAKHAFAAVCHSTDIAAQFGAKPDLCVYAGVPAAMFLANADPDAALAVMAAARENLRQIAPKQLVLISSIAVYADSRGKDEQSPMTPDGLPAYGRNRLQLERWVREDYPNALIVRLPALYGIGLKKNFLFDLHTITPSMLKPEKYTELAQKSPLVRDGYTLADNGFYKLNGAVDAAALREFFAGNDFNALAFTDSRSRYQFYHLARRCQDVQHALQNRGRVGGGCPFWGRLEPPDTAAEGDAVFAKAGALASHYDVVLAIEANPPVYTNYLNNTADAFAMVKRLQSPGLAVNLDLSTMISNGERLRDFVDDIKYVSHVHISEPGLEPIVPRQEHKELAMLLKAVGYSGDVSIEMKRTDVETVRKTLAYIAEVFA